MTVHWWFEIGDLVRSKEPVIAHGCNTVGVMGAGIARQIREEIPEAYEAYRAEPTLHLGSAQCVWTGDRTVFNLMTQRNPGPDATTNAITMAFANMAEQMYQQGLDRVAIPRIGCGIGGLKWPDVALAIQNGMALAGVPSITVAVYDLP